MTGWHPAGWDQYAKRFCQTFAQHWLAEIDCVAYVEERIDPSPARIEQRSLWLIDGAKPFLERHMHNKEACGRAPRAGWKDSDRRNGYSFRFDAVKFFKQLIIPSHCAQSLRDGDVLAWLDADVVSLAPVPGDLITGLLSDADVCFLGRGAKHSEIGFWAVRLSPVTRRFLDALADCYRSDHVFKLAQWHSAFVFDHVRNEFGNGLRQRDLTPGGTGHVWFQCKPLAHCLDHLKGDRRKRLGRSPEKAYAAR